MRKVLLILMLLVVSAAALFQFAGYRMGFDGSGYMPRFVAASPDYDALEADRARQRAAAPAPVAAAPAVSDVPVPVTVPRSPEAPAGDRVEAPALDAPTPAAWPDYRGPRRDGRYDGAPILTEWPASGLRALWRQPVGPGYASFVVADGRAFTIEQRRSQEVVAAYDVTTGREQWTVQWEGEFQESMGGDGPRATPTYHDGHVYALGAFGELRAIEARTGRVVWRRNILSENGAPNLDWGMSAAPLIVGETVVVLPGGPGGRSVVAYHRLTGERVWSALDDRQAYTSPMLVTIAGVPQILVVSATRAFGLTTDGGRVLWEYPWPTSQGINAAQPLLLGNDRIFLSASYGQGAAVLEVREGSPGTFTAGTVWQNQRMKNKFTSSVLHEGHIYGLDESILACLDAATGDVRWKAGRYGYGQVLLAGDRLIVLTEDGDLVQVRATPRAHEELASFHAIDGKTWNHPVIADGRLLVRNIREMAAFDVGLD